MKHGKVFYFWFGWFKAPIFFNLLDSVVKRFQMEHTYSISTMMTYNVILTYRYIASNQDKKSCKLPEFFLKKKWKGNSIDCLQV